jgi:hypothetical protein
MTTTDPMKKAGDLTERLQQQVKRAMTEAAPEQKKENRFFQTEPPPPLPEGVCQSCGGIGMFKYDVRYTDPRFGKWFPCPKCTEGQDIIKKRNTRLFTSSDMPVEYEKYRLRHFLPNWIEADGLHDDLLEGKRLGIGMAWQFINNSDHGMNERDVYRMWIEFYAAYRDSQYPDGIPAPALWQRKVANGSEQKRYWLVLQGFNGTGKTALASAIANEMMERGVSVLYVRVDDYIQKVTSTNKKQPEGEEPLTEMEVVDAARNPDVLILDDMNVSKVSEYGRKIMEMVIRHRHNHHKPTIITLNTDEQSFEQEWQPRIASAVFGAAHWVTFNGATLRDERHSLDPF